MDVSERFDAFIIGPGISRNYQTLEFVAMLLKELKKPVVLDADGLYALKLIMKSDEKISLSNVVITPHPGG